jgi:hypothetical protein
MFTQFPDANATAEHETRIAERDAAAEWAGSAHEELARTSHARAQAGLLRGIHARHTLR